KEVASRGSPFVLGRTSRSSPMKRFYSDNQTGPGIMETPTQTKRLSMAARARKISSASTFGQLSQTDVFDATVPDITPRRHRSQEEFSQPTDCSACGMDGRESDQDCFFSEVSGGESDGEEWCGVADVVREDGEGMGDSATEIDSDDYVSEQERGEVGGPGPNADRAWKDKLEPYGPDAVETVTAWVAEVEEHRQERELKWKARVREWRESGYEGEPDRDSECMGVDPESVPP
ncbi:hypothetical protein KIPB_015471, partial [Kipferlia bialata]